MGLFDNNWFLIHLNVEIYANNKKKYRKQVNEANTVFGNEENWFYSKFGKSLKSLFSLKLEG